VSGAINASGAMNVGCKRILANMADISYFEG